MKLLVILLSCSYIFANPIGNETIIGGEERIVGGQLAKAGQFPYQAGLYLFKSFNSDKAAKCGGSLISDVWIVTAAHCSTGKVRANIFLGTRNLRRPDRNSQIFQSTKIYTNPDFDHKSLKNDIGLVRLPTKARMTKYVQTIPMSSSSSSFTDQWATASGYGKISDTESTNELRYVDLQVISVDDCQDEWDDDTIDDSQICVYTDDPPHQTCEGDSGGPLVLKKSKQLIGITSYGTSSCTDGTPVVFTRLNTQKDFIYNTTGIQF